MVASHYENISTPDGTFEAYCALPDGDGPWPGVVLFQEIFGINDNMRWLADRAAGAGFLALVPDMFWRLEPRFERKDESGLGDAMNIVMQFDQAAAMVDMQATFTHLIGMTACDGNVGSVGFCLGGALSFGFAATVRVDGHGPDAMVSYYGSAVNDLLGMADQIQCPMLFHYGTNDAFIPTENIDQVEAVVAGRPDVGFYRYDAGHAFSNADAPSMYVEAAATQAWARTLDFLGAHLRS